MKKKELPTPCIKCRRFNEFKCDTNFAWSASRPCAYFTDDPKKNISLNK